MKSLFLKIFLWFFGTSAAIFLAISAGFVRDAPSALLTNWLDLGHRAIVMSAEASADSYERGGPEELSRTIGRFREGLGIHAVLLDRSGADLGAGGLALSPKILRQLNAAAEQELTVADRLRGVAGVRVRGPKGVSYLFVVVLPTRESTVWGRMLVASFLVVGFFLCYLLARYITSPVTHLRQLTRKFSQGDLGARVTMPAIVQRRDEIGELARDFNHMASRIDSLMQAQRRLIGDVSHELRSPITRLSLALGLMRQRGASGDPTSLSRISREVERLNALIGQLLTLSRLEYLDLPGPMEEVDLSAMVREIASDADFEAGSAGIGVRLVQCDPCTMHGTPDLLRSAIENVVRNAVKYTEPETHVSMQLIRAADGRTAEIVVQDQGPGLPDAELAHIFEPFYRVDAARDRHTGGVGLGLAITQRIVTLHRGSVCAANRVGGGMEFRIEFPLA